MILLITLFFTFIPTGASSVSSPSSISVDLTTQAISIVGNDEFNITANEFNWPGSGTDADPYYLELSITAGNPIQVNIKDTTVYFIINNSLISGGSSAGIYFENVENAVIANSTISENNYGIHFVNSTDNTIINNTVTQNQETAIRFQESPSNRIINNTVTQNGLSYLESLSLSSHLAGGILMNPSPHNNITGNIIQDNFGVGILVRESNYNRVEDNLISHNSDFGVHSMGSLYTQYKFNTISYNGYNPVDTNLDGLHLNSHLAGGILMNPSHYNLLLNNSIHHNEGDGVYAHEIMGLEAYNNTIYNNLEHGIELERVNDSIFVQNTIVTNAAYGVKINGSNNITLSDNNIMDNTLGDVFIESSSQLVTVTSTETVKSPSNLLPITLFGLIVLVPIIRRKYWSEN